MPADKNEDPNIPQLNRVQLHVLQILWDASEPLKPAEIEEQFTWPIENATLRSILAVLMDRGEVARERRGKAFVYFPAREKRSALSDLMSGLAHVFSSGSRVGLLAQLLQDETLTSDEVRELSEIVRRHEEESSNPESSES